MDTDTHLRLQEIARTETGQRDLARGDQRGGDQHPEQHGAAVETIGVTMVAGPANSRTARNFLWSLVLLSLIEILLACARSFAVSALREKSRLRMMFMRAAYRRSRQHLKHQLLHEAVEHRRNA